MYDKKKLDELKGSLEKWEKTSLQKALDQLPERTDKFITTSSEPINRLYTPQDIAEHGMPALKSSFFPLDRTQDVFTWDPL